MFSQHRSLSLCRTYPRVGWSFFVEETFEDEQVSHVNPSIVRQPNISSERLAKCSLRETRSGLPLVQTGRRVNPAATNPGLRFVEVREISDVGVLGHLFALDTSWNIGGIGRNVVIVRQRASATTAGGLVEYW